MGDTPNERARKRRRPWPALAVSVLAHGALLLAIVRVGPPLIRPGPSQIDLTLVPPLALAPSAISAHRALPASARASRPSPEPRVATEETPEAVFRPASAPTTPAVQSSPRAASASISATVPGAANDDLNGCRREDLILMSAEQRRRCEDRLAAARNGFDPSLGCASNDGRHRTAEQRDVCDRWRTRVFAQGSYQRIDPIPAGKRAYYDAVQQAYEEVREGVPAESPLSQNPYADRIPHGHDLSVSIGMTCSFGAGARGSPDGGGIKIGGCHLLHPRGFGTEELGIPPP